MSETYEQIFAGMEAQYRVQHGIPEGQRLDVFQYRTILQLIGVRIGMRADETNVQSNEQKNRVGRILTIYEDLG
jgi:hypothetical protein